METVGILGLGVYLPEGRMSAKEIADATQGVWSEQAIVDKLGIVQKTMPAPSDGTQEMGALASLKAIENAGIDPKDIDVILCFGEEWKEYPLTTSALYIQDRIGAVNAWGIDVQNRCCTSVTALKMAKDMLIADEEIDTILVCGGYRNGDFVDYTDKNMSMMYNLSAGGGALILRKGLKKNLLLGSHIISDGSLARTAGVEIGGTAENNVALKDGKLGLGTYKYSGTIAYAGGTQFKDSKGQMTNPMQTSNQGLDPCTSRAYISSQSQSQLVHGSSKMTLQFENSYFIK